MPLNKTKGNMYPWCDMTWNPISGRCLHDCSYCYMRRFKLEAIRLKEEELKVDLGSGRTIFVGSSTDMFGANVPKKWISAVLERCRDHDNTYLFQTKNPWRFHYFPGEFPEKSIYGTTLESDILYIEITIAPSPFERLTAMLSMEGKRRMISIEPILKFSNRFINMIREIAPEFVSIGADSKGHGLPEPTAEEITQLILELEMFTAVKLKKNLRRILGNEKDN